MPEPGADVTAVTLGRYRAHVNRGLAALAETLFPIVEVRSQGSYVFDSGGRRYLDLGGFGVFLLGHRHPRIVEAVKRQLDAHPLGTRLLVNPTLGRAAEALAGVSPPGLEYAYLTTSGTEAVETALKLARLNGKRSVIAAVGGFHGKTLGSLSASGREVYRSPFEPLLPRVTHVPFGEIASIERQIEAEGDRACVLLEPVQGEGGVVLAPEGYLKAVESCCHRHGAMLILDEVLTGLGRIGSWWGAGAAGVEPDIVTAGKALGGGVMPVGAVLATPAAFEPLNRDPFLHSSTFGGSPLAAAAVEATVETVLREEVVERVGSLAPLVESAIRAALEPTGARLVEEIRCAGLLIGIECREPGLAGELIYELVREGIIASASLNASDVVRLTPPVTLADDDLGWLRTGLERAALRVMETT
jgi:putrescine aminotransferase